jgi:hypothetical protein
MMKFKVEVTEHYQKVYEIEAESEDEAYDLVRSDEYMPSSYECDDCTYWCDRKIEEVR